MKIGTGNKYHESLIHLVWRDWSQCEGAMLSPIAKWFMRGNSQLGKIKLYKCEKVYSSVIYDW